MLKYKLNLVLQATLLSTLASLSAQEASKLCTRADQTQLFTTLFTQNSAYAQDFAERLNAVVSVFHDLVGHDIHKRVHACLAFPFQTLEEPYKQTLDEVIRELIPLYYSPDGMLETLLPDDVSKRNFCIAKLLKTDLDYSNYKRLLTLFKFTEVIAHEEHASSYVWNNLCSFAAGNWLPDFYSYPVNIIERIQNNHANKVLARVHTLCAHHEYAQAWALIKEQELPLCTQLFDECYATFKNKYCDENGVIKKY